MPFGTVLKSLRTKNKMTQKELADTLGVSESRIGMYERCQREPDFEMLEVIADYFNVEIDYLLGRSSTRPEFNLEEQWIISCYRNADEDTKVGIKSILRRFDEKELAVSSVS